MEISEMSEAQRLGPKGNNPPSDAEILQMEIDELRALLEKDAADLIKRSNDLIAAFANVPLAIENDTVAGKVTDMGSMVAACWNAIEQKRKDRKEPFLAKERAVDAFFKTHLDGLTKIKSSLGGLITAYKQKLEKEERDRRAEEARKAKEEADRLAAIAAAQEKAKMPEQAAQTMEKAVEQEIAAQEVAATVNAPIAPAAPIRGSYGSSSSVRGTWKIEVDKTKVDLEALRPFLGEEALQKAANQLLKTMTEAEKASGGTLKGARVFKSESTSFR